MNLAIYHSLSIFVANHWQSFMVSVFAGLISTGLVAIMLIKIFRVPSFDLHLDYIRGKMTNKGYSLPVLDISIVNKKRWIGFGNEEVLFGLFILVDFTINKNLHLITTKGMEKWLVDTRGKDIFKIHNEEYLLYRGVVPLAVHPDSRTHFLRMDGDFDKDTVVKIYYYFETPYGRFPTFLKFGKRIETAESGKLPCAEMRFD